MDRRRFLFGLVAAVAAPAVIRTPGLLMPVKPFYREYYLVTNYTIVQQDLIAIYGIDCETEMEGILAEMQNAAIYEGILAELRRDESEDFLIY